MTQPRPLRSVLYMPGSNPRAIEKARTLPCDGVILDLEDAVAPEAKAEARDLIAQACKAGGFGHRFVLVRVNGSDTEWGEVDMQMACAAAPDAILIPKVSSAAVVLQARQKIREFAAPDTTELWAMMETPLAMMNAGEIAAAKDDGGRGLSGFVMGTNDLAKDTGARFVPGRLPMLTWLSTSIAAARAHGLLILDGVFNGLDDADGFATECEQGRDLGMDGKTLIHPKQIELANAVFAPGADEVAFARQITAAFAEPKNAGKGVLRVEGKMVERLHAEMALRTVALADAIAAREE